MDHDTLKNYELAFVVKDESSAPSVLTLLKQHGAEIDFEGPLQEMRLAYPMRKENHGYFGYFHFRMLPDKAHTLERDLNLNPRVLRSLIITPPFTRAQRENQGAPERTREVGAGVAVRESAAPAPRASTPLSNEELEKKIGEILQ